MGVFDFVWHVILLIWITGVSVTVVVVRNRRNALSRQVHQQVLQTRMAELQARERRALDVH